jgi:hypothetical protein
MSFVFASNQCDISCPADSTIGFNNKSPFKNLKKISLFNCYVNKV